MSLNVPPRVECSWTATVLGAAFGSYNLYRRPSRTPALGWAKIAQLGVPLGYTPATVEAQHVQFVDYEPGWAFAGGQWTAGWDYAITVTNALTGIESPKTIIAMNVVTPDNGYWATSNLFPFFNFPLASVPQWASADDQGLLWRGRAAGRDEALVRVAAELPARELTVQYKDFARVGEDGIRTWRAAQAAGATIALLSVRGDRSIGALTAPVQGQHDHTGVVAWQGKHIETLREPNYVLAGHNLPAGLALNGTTQAVTIADNALINPAGAFTVCMVFRIPSSAAIKALLCKGDANGGTINGYGLLKDAADKAIFKFKGVTAAGSINGSAVVGDGAQHTVIARSSGTAQELFVDGISIGTAAVTHGAINSGTALAAGADNNLSALFAPMTPVIAFGMYNRRLTDAEVAAAHGDLANYPNARMPAGAAAFVDLRDQRCWSGVTTPVDLSGNALPVALVAAPVTRGIPWPVTLIDRF